MDRRGVSPRRALMALVPAVAAAMPASPGAAQTRRQTPFTITAPDPSPDGGRFGPVVLAIIDHDRAFPSGGFYCPPPAPGESEEDAEICLGADIVEGPAEIVRYLSPVPEGWATHSARPRVRFIGAHAVRWVDAGRQVAILESTDDGYLWRSWSAPVVNGWACFNPAIIQAFRLTSRLRLRPHGDAPHCFELSSLE